mgnify:CR=1 FL=1|jgi:hypothetical protein|tara:strand:- start:442 stop:720 length:279 start_codon:yes stop_codon:yes gene_type:complete
MNIDGVSKTLGELVASVQSLTNQTRDQWEKLDEIEKHAAKWESLAEDVADMKPHVDDYKRLKQRGIGMFVILGLLFGGLGAGIVYVFEKFMP